MINFLYSIYSISSGLFAYLLFGHDVLRALLFLLIIEFAVFIYYQQTKNYWNFKKRFIFAILYFLGYFSIFFIDNDLEFEKPI